MTRPRGRRLNVQLQRGLRVYLILFYALALSSCSTEPAETSPPAETLSNPPTNTTAASSGNNAETRDFAAAMTEITKQTWPKGEVVWSLELTPKRIADDIVSYRKRVTFCKATISVVLAEWVSVPENDQRAFVRSAMNVLHKPPAFSTGNLDYYPNSSGEVFVVQQGSDLHWARGTYTGTKTSVRLLSDPSHEPM
jgi:hypothetical protein